MEWRPVIRAVLDGNEGLATRRQLLHRVPSLVLDGHVGRKNLVRIFSHVYRLRDTAETEVLLLRAALPSSVGQYRVQLPTRVVKLDRAWPEAKLAVELDGARHHTSPEDRQADLARDRALAAAGWVVLRFTYADVLGDPEGVRARVLEVYRTRRSQLHAS